ncbi:MAG: lysine exporter LysO family protein [Eubacteriales bacterium]|nr:lysine exporter LysO family protein [Eubacteriales bacterium]
MVKLTLLALILGIIYGLMDINIGLIDLFSSHTDAVLYILMFSVGISVGLNRGIVQKIKKYHFKIFIIPICIMLASFLGGIVCGMLSGLPLSHAAAVASGMGWYSLAGATLTKLVGAELGSIAFLSNLMREIFSFFIIPFIASKFNYYTCIAPAGATSEDTTLPMMMRYTNEETVVISVLNGMICSAFVPVMISFCLEVL